MQEGSPKRAHTFMTRRSKSVPMRNKMPNLTTKASPLVAAINLHEKAFKERSKDYKKQRRAKLEAERQAEEERRRVEEARTEARLAEHRRQKMEEVGRIFGDGVCAEDMVAYAQQQKEKRAKKKQAKAAKKAQKERQREEQCAAVQENTRLRAETTANMKLWVLNMVHSAVEKGEATAARREEEVALVIERVILDIESNVKGERFDILVRRPALFSPSHLICPPVTS